MFQKVEVFPFINNLFVNVNQKSNDCSKIQVILVPSDVQYMCKSLDA